MIGILVAALLAACVTMLVTPAVQRWSERRQVMDQPEERRVNTQPMPRAGGIAILAGILAAALVTISARALGARGLHVWSLQVVGVLVTTVFIGAIGLLDDMRDLSAKWQAVALVAAGVMLAGFGVRIEGFGNPFAGLTGAAYNPAVQWHGLGTAVSVLITVAWVFVVTKTVDAIDGVDGLAAGVCAISAATLALLAVQQHGADGPTLGLIGAAVVGAAIGFLRHNYHPAKIIMGTVGAWVLGFLLSAISIMGAFKVAAAVSVLVPVLVLGVPIFDYTHVLARRFLARAPLTQADTRHLHHRLLALGWNQRQVVWFIYGVTLLCCAAALVLFATSHGR